jgi:hypothetical protein
MVKLSKFVLVCEPLLKNAGERASVKGRTVSGPSPNRPGTLDYPYS